MKKFTKNVLACLGIGAVISGAGVMTGCESKEQESVIQLVQESDIKKSDALTLMKSAVASFLTNAHNEWDNMQVTRKSDGIEFVYDSYKYNYYRLCVRHYGAVDGQYDIVCETNNGIYSASKDGDYK